MNDKPNPTDADRLELLDRIAERLPDLDLSEREIEWTTLPDGHEAILVDGGGVDGGRGVCIANVGEKLHAVGPIPCWGVVGCIVIEPDGTRYLAQVQPDPLAQEPEPDEPDQF